MHQSGTAARHERARSSVTVRLRASLLVALATTTLVAAWELVGAPAVVTCTSTVDPTFAELLEAGCGLVLVGCALWAELVTVAVGVEAIRCRRSPALDAVAPAALRRFLLGCCGVALIGGLGLAPASAAVAAVADVADAPGAAGTAGTADTARAGSAARQTELPLSGLSLPDRPAGAAPVGPSPDTERTSASHRSTRRTDVESTRHAVSRAPAATPTGLRPGQVRVQPGDTLWSLSAERLAPGRAPRAVNHAWHALYQRNRDVIGPDPDLILPGTVLDLPDELAPTPRGEEHR